MKSRLIVMVFILSVMVCLQAGVEYYLEIEPVEGRYLEKLSRLVSIDKFEKGKIYAYASQKEYDRLFLSGFIFNEIPGPLTGFEPVMTSSAGDVKNWDSYPTYEAFVETMYQFAEDYPEICEVFSIGSSGEGREVLVAHIGDDLAVDENEPEFYYTGQIHGDELVTFIVLLHLIDELLENYGSEPRITNIVDNIDIYINPLNNPDGTYAGGNHTVAGATRSNSNGVDLNRNYPDFEDGPHPDGNDYQPETLIQMAFAAAHNFVMCSNLHSGAEVVNYPWDTWAILHADDNWWQQVSHTYADAVHEIAPGSYMDGFNNGITNGYQWYTTAGNHQDYMNWYHRCRDVTLELSNVKPLPESQLEDHYQWNYNSLLLYMEECLYGIRGFVEDEAGNPLEAMICIPEHDMHHSEVVTDADYGNYHRPIYFGSYDLEISAWGYMTEEMNGVTAPLHDITWQDVTLQPAALCQLSGEVTDLESGLPVFGAWVELLDTPLEAVMTDPEGCFSINDIPVDEYQIAVFAGGYNSSLETINLETGMNIYNCQLQSSPALSFESGEFPAGFDFYSSGNANWFITDDSAHNGLYAARSGDIDDREITTLHLDIELEEAGSINFWLKVSSEADWDFLYFYIDDDLQDEWSGSIDWTEQSYNLSEGEHQLKWEYDKDTSVSSGSDCAWLDDILITGLPEVETVFGDIDNNGVVEAFDASLVQRFVVGIFPGPAAPLPWQYWRLIRADVDGNLIIEAYDASLILQYWVGLINSFPVEVRAGK